VIRIPWRTEEESGAKSIEGTSDFTEQEIKKYEKMKYNK